MDAETERLENKERERKDGRKQKHCDEIDTALGTDSSASSGLLRPALALLQRLTRGGGLRLRG